MPHRGVVFVAFGEDYYKQGIAAALLVHNHLPDLSITLVTNSLRIEHISTVFHIVLPAAETSMNRLYRTMANRFAFDADGLYDEWALLDTDVAIMSPRFMDGFDILQGHDAAALWQAFGNDQEHLVTYCGGHWRDFLTYRSLTYPVMIYTPGTCFFKSGPTVDRFFECWQEIWKGWDGPRDLPPFTCAAQEMELDIIRLSPRISYHWILVEDNIKIPVSLHYAPGILPPVKKWRPEGFDGKDKE